MEKNNEIKGEWRAGIYDYGMFVENMRKLDDLRKKKSNSEEYEETVAAAFGIFCGVKHFFKKLSKVHKKVKFN